MPELRAANTGDIAVVVAIIILTMSHVGTRYFGGLFELCRASPAHAPEPLMFVVCEVTRQSGGPCRKQVKNKNMKKLMGTRRLKGATGMTSH